MSRPWVYWLLCLVALALVVVNVRLNLREVTAARPEGGRDLPTAVLAAKMLVLAGPSEGEGAPAGADHVAQLLDEASKRGEPSARARALRRKAIWCDFSGAPGAKEALDALAEIGEAERAPAPADEAALLREAVGGAPIARERAEPLGLRLTEIHLGWFDHLLRQRLHHHAGDEAAADRELADAREGARRAALASAALLALMATGGIAWLIALVHPARRRVTRELAERLRAPETLEPGDASRLLAVFVGFLAAALALGPLLRALGLRRAATPLGGALQSLGAELALGLVVLLLHRVFRRAGAPPPALGFAGSSVGRALNRGAFVYLLLLPTLFFVVIPLSALFRRLGLPDHSHPIAEQLQAASASPAALVVWFLVAAVAAPLLEEAVFRGALQRALRARLGGRWAIVVSSLAFAVIHPQVGIGLVAVLVIGLTLALTREHEGSLWPGVVLHACNNGAILAIAMAMLAD